ncbi:hypothetical protein C095_02145 [Fusobacterium necrophorum subsp. funduliforme B35]|uniref:Uncharacterized protein n=1 Tax=Fusobacterium necrophorum subsp. funduliforme B35 TaxID=1226633 RepID=A0A0B4FR94_9FUSO|nr:hypothetical protein C095_02145 [Fusobacterium necrophorum subsp. funduliforme B35]
MNLIASIGQEEEKKIIGRIGGNVPCFFLIKKRQLKSIDFIWFFKIRIIRKNFSLSLFPMNMALCLIGIYIQTAQ